LALAISSAFAPAITRADEVATRTPVKVVLDEITVSATRTDRNIDAVPVTVSIISAEKIEASGARNIKDIFNDDLSVTVPQGPTRFNTGASATGRAGNASINVRGLEGNQVLLLQDGIRVPNSFSFGPFSTGRGEFVEVNGMKNVEVLRGPSSTQYGSDGLAGAVLFRTLNPEDVLNPGQTLSGYARSGYSSIDNSWSNTIAMAGAKDRWQGLLLASYQAGHEIKNQGENNSFNPNRTSANPVDYTSPYFLGKVIYALNTSQQLGLTLESQKRTQDTEVYTARALPPLKAKSVTDLSTHDQSDRNRISIDYQFKDASAPWIQRAESHLYRQHSQVAQAATQQYFALPTSNLNNTYQTNVVGVSTLFESNVKGWLDQRLTYGFEWSKSDIQAQLDGKNVPNTQNYPYKPFPDSSFVQTGAFVQSEIETGKLSIIPGLRFDQYSLTPDRNGYASPIVSLSGSAVTPRLGFVWQLTPAFAPFGQIARGFRAPTPDQVNNGFSNLAYGYTSIGNPNLKPEYADSIELGFRGKVNDVRYSLSAYDNRYTDFITQQVVSGTGRPADPMVFQYINLSKAHIHGVELRTDWKINSQWSSNAGLAYSKGNSEIAGVTSPLNTVQPMKAVLGLRYDTGLFGAKANLIYIAAKDNDQIAVAVPSQFAPPSSTVLDLGVFWKFKQNLSFNFNVNNAFNSKYWRWSDVNGLAKDSAVVDAYTAPGRNYQASLRYDF